MLKQINKAIMADFIKSFLLEKNLTMKKIIIAYNKSPTKSGIIETFLERIPKIINYES